MIVCSVGSNWQELSYATRIVNLQLHQMQLTHRQTRYQISQAVVSFMSGKYNERRGVNKNRTGFFPQKVASPVRVACRVLSYVCVLFYSWFQFKFCLLRPFVRFIEHYKGRTFPGIEEHFLVLFVCYHFSHIFHSDIVRKHVCSTGDQLYIEFPVSYILRIWIDSFSHHGPVNLISRP